MSRAVRIFWRLFFIGLGAFALLLILINFGVFGKMPSLAELENPSIKLATEVYGEDGTLMGKFYMERSNRTSVKYKDISKNVINALVSTEDKRFYNHSGIDWKRLGSAIAKLGRDGGASTITQQLALNMFNERSSNPVKRIMQKLKEWIIAIKLERNFTKQEILTLYLNTVPFGDNTYGIRNASRTFFQKEPDRLNVEEAAVLIGMLKANWGFNPRHNYKAAFNRRNTVMKLMVESNYLSAAEYSKLKGQPIQLNYKKLDENNGIAPYFLENVRDDLKDWCKDHKKSNGQPYDIYEDGLKVFTTINPRMQMYAEEAVAKHMPVLQRVLSRQRNVRTDAVWKGHENVLQAAMRNSDRWHNMKDDGYSDEDIRKAFQKKIKMKVFAWTPEREKDTLMTPYDSIRYHREMLQTAFMVMDPMSGEVKAWVGGIDFRNYKYDHVNINTKRQVGSAIKPFLYSLAIEEYGFTPETPCEDTQQYFPGSGFVPARNRGHSGTRTMANALAFSVNEVAAYLIKQTTPERFAEFIQQINIPTKVEPYPSISLGTCDLSLFEMLWGYTMFPSGGFSTKPVYITRIEDKNGNVLARFNTVRKEVISQNTAYTMTRMMQGVTDYGTAAGLRSRIGVAEMGGKTGTTNDNSDAWFLGYTPQLLGGVWIGCDDRFVRLESNLGYGGAAARPIWEYFFKKALADKTLGLDRQAKFIQPENMKNELYPYSALDMSAGNAGDEAPVPNAGADYDYLSKPDTQNIPVESKLSLEEQRIYKEATENKKKDDNKKKDSDDKAGKDKKDNKKKDGFFRRLFKKKDKDNN